MNFLAFIIGTTLPLSLGWLSLILLERTHPVLGRFERWFFALVLGPTEFALIVFIPHILGLTSLNLLGFLMPSLMILIVLLTLAFSTKAFAARKYIPEYAGSPPSPAGYGGAGIALPKAMKIGILLLTIWTVIKILAGSFDLISVPTYWDDSFNNWNMRGKMFFLHEQVILEIPIGNGLIQGSDSVSSYPATVPLLKTWLSVLRGSWQEPLVNGLHLVWLVGLIGTFYFGLRRSLSPMLSLLGVSLLVSLPLLLIQATNPYADIFMAAHVLVPMLCLLAAAKSHDAKKVSVWMTIFGFSLGLMLLTKNEATVLYSPIMGMLFVWILLRKKSMGEYDNRTLWRIVIVSAPLALLVGTPWILFKWTNGLTFGNAKSVSGVTLSLNTKVIQSIWFHLTHEPNWLLLPLSLLAAIAASGRRAFRLSEKILTVFVILTISAQFLLFTFVAPLATEAIMQTGLSRGLLHIAPVAMMLLMLLTKRLIMDEE